MTNITENDVQDILNEYNNPTNESTIFNPVLTNDSQNRFQGASWFETAKNNEIILAGLGGIGSWTALLLSRLNPKSIYLYDDDKVEETNMSGQFYSDTVFGTTKIEATYHNLAHFSKYFAMCYNRKYDENSIKTPVMICGFDNMKARKVFFNNWFMNICDKDNNASKCLFIDGRLNAEEFQIFCFTGDNMKAIKKYQEEYLFDDDEVENSICSYKQTSFCASMIASFITNLYINFCDNKKDGFRPLPFLTYYNAYNLKLDFNYVE